MGNQDAYLQGGDIPLVNAIGAMGTILQINTLAELFCHMYQ